MELIEDGDTPKPCSSPHCIFSSLIPLEYSTTLFPLSPLIEGLDIPGPFDIIFTPGNLERDLLTYDLRIGFKLSKLIF